MDIKLEYMIESYNVKFEELEHFCETAALLGTSIKFVAKKAITTIIMALSVIRSVLF